MSLRSQLRRLLTLGTGVARGIPDASGDRDPIELFGQWYAAAERSGLLLPEAMTVASATPDGRPSARVILLKEFDENGFVFFTNYESRKSHELDQNPQVALVFHWAVLQRQVRVEGTATRVSEDESMAYFQTRPRGSRIGAWASRQSAPLRDREQLMQRVRDVEAEYKNADVPLPPFWGGYRVHPRRIEFWQGRTSRLHDRFCFDREGDRWKCTRLYP